MTQDEIRQAWLAFDPANISRLKSKVQHQDKYDQFAERVFTMIARGRRVYEIEDYIRRVCQKQLGSQKSNVEIKAFACLLMGQEVKKKTRAPSA